MHATTPAHPRCLRLRVASARCTCEREWHGADVNFGATLARHKRLEARRRVPAPPPPGADDMYEWPTLEEDVAYVTDDLTWAWNESEFLKTVRCDD